MPDLPRRCERCGESIIAVDAMGGACPRCMLQIGLDSPSQFDVDVSDRTDLPGVGTTSRSLAIARYRILKVIGEGGMGAVYEAEQDHPRRIVALKIIKPGLSNPKLLRRFEQESQALGRLQHPGIAQIYEAGTADTGLGPQPYFAMELIRGRTLESHAEARHLNPRERLEIVARIAEAVHHAHQRGVIHRDLKPGNILVDETGQPKILDFGIARAMDSDTRATSQTDVGQLLGTLTYMSPEQMLADPLEIDTRSDVYSLGVILYELLAGRLPYTEAKTLPDTLRAIRDEEPVRLGLINRRYRGDIETIVATALEKDKSRRYGSAADLAADIGRHLADQPIVARPPTAAYQLRKFARRNRALVTGAAAVGAALLVAAVVSIWSAGVARRALARATAAQDLATAQRNAALAAERHATQELDRAVKAETQLRSALDRALAAESQLRNALERALSAETTAGQKSDLARELETAAEQARKAAEAAATEATAARDARLEAERRVAREQERATDEAARALSAAADLREDRDRNLWQEMARESIRLASTRVDDDLAALLARQAFTFSQRSPDSARAPLIEDALHQASRATPWSHNLVSAQRGVALVQPSPDGTKLAINGSDGTIEIWDLQRPTSPPRVLVNGTPSREQALFIAFSPDSTHLAAGGFLSGGGRRGGTRGASPPSSVASPVRVWDLRAASSSPVLLHGHPREVLDGAFSSDGKHLATTDSQSILVWEAGKPAAPPKVLLRPETAHLARLAFQGRALLQTPPPSAPGVTSLAFSPVYWWRLATADRQGVRFWDLRDPDRPQVLPDTENAQRVLFSRDGSRLAVLASSGLQVLDTRDPLKPVTVYKGSRYATVALSPEGTHFASGVGATVQIWDMRSPENGPSLMLRGHQDQILSVAFSSDGSRVISGSSDKTARVWELRRPGGPLVLPRAASAQTVTSSRPLHVITVAADGYRVYSGTPTGVVKRWDLRATDAEPELLLSERMRAVAPGPGPARGPSYLRVMDLSSSGNRFALAAGDNETRVWDVRNPNASPIELRNRDAAPGQLAVTPVTALKFSPDESELALARGGTTTIWLWDLRTRMARSLSFPGTGLLTFAYSPDGSKFAAGQQQDVLVWDRRKLDAQPVSIRQVSQSNAITAIAFSFDSSRLAVASDEVRIWDLRALRPTSTALRGIPGTRPQSLAFSPGDELLAAGNINGTVQVWDLRNFASPLVSLGYPYTPTPIGTPVAGASSLAFASQGRQLLIGGTDGSVRAWSFGAAAADALCARVSRNLSMNEWRRYVGENVPYEHTCPGLPPGLVR